MSEGPRKASIAGEWGLSSRALASIGNSSLADKLPAETDTSKLLQLGESLRNFEGEKIMKTEINTRAPSLCIENHEIDDLLHQLNSVALIKTSSKHITPLFKQADLYKALSETWESKSNDFEKHIINKSLEASKNFVELDPLSRKDEMLRRLNENSKVLYITEKEGKLLAISSRYIIRSEKGIFKTLTPPIDIDTKTLNQCLKYVDENTCARHDILRPTLNQVIMDQKKTNYLIDWLQDLGIIIPHTVKIGDTNFFYIFPARTVDIDKLDTEKIAPNIRDIISHFYWASEFSTIKYPGVIIRALAAGRRIGPAVDIPSKYMSLIGRGLVKVENNRLAAVDMESFQRAETLVSGGENIDFSKLDMKLPSIPSGSMLFGESQTKILLDAAKRGGLYPL